MALAVCLLALVAIFLPWLLGSGLSGDEFTGFEYDYTASEARGVVRYRIRLDANEPGFSAHGFYYRKERFRSRRGLRSGKPIAATAGSAAFTDAELRPVGQAARSWKPLEGTVYRASSQQAEPELRFYRTFRHREWNGNGVIYDSTISGTGPAPREVVDLIGAVARAMPARVRERYAMPVPAAGAGGQRGGR